MTQPGETDGYTASRHLKAIIKHCGGVIDKVIVNNENISPKLKEKYQAQGAKPVNLMKTIYEN